MDSSSTYIYSTLALVFVIGLILLLAYLVRRFGFIVAGSRSRRRRLAVVEAVAVDTRRRLVLVRRDATEHLLLIGGTTDMVVETGIPAEGFRQALLRQDVPEKTERTQ
ncbi:MAG: hypothetical protein FD149_1917 [Rhodospirillaceae bacterium]|nr:MAG: hypothetical protein FD149_1917 [Rhodospirillaceae bacterium]